MESGILRRISVGILVVSVGFASVGCSGGTVSPVSAVKDWVVSFATAVGQYITATAQDFAQALHRAWIAFFQKYSDVVQDKNDPKKGIFAGILKCEVAWGKEMQNKLRVELDHPRMQRSEEGAEWELDQPAREKIEDLHRQLLKAN